MNFFTTIGICCLRVTIATLMKQERAALLIRCSSREAELIRIAAKGERRTLSGFVLNAVLKYLAERVSTGKYHLLSHDAISPRRM